MMERTEASRPVAVICGFGPGIGTSLATRLLAEGYAVAGLSRSGRSYQDSAGELMAIACDVGDAEAVEDAFSKIATELGAPEVMVHCAAQLVVGDFLDTAPSDFEEVWRNACLSAVLCTQRALPPMLRAKAGSIVFAGATASTRGGPKFSAFASAKFALRGLAQSLARAYGPQGVHVAHVVIDGVIWGERAEKSFGMQKEACMDPDDIAAVVMQLIGQNPSCWTHELDLRPSKESF